MALDTGMTQEEVALIETYWMQLIHTATVLTPSIVEDMLTLIAAEMQQIRFDNRMAQQVLDSRFNLNAVSSQK